MAKAKIRMSDDFELKLSKLGKNIEPIAEKVLTAGAEVALKEVKSRLKGVIGNDLAEKSRSTGELIGALGISPMQLDKKDNMLNVKVGFYEPRRKQYPAKRKRSYYTITNAMIANVIEHGKKKLNQTITALEHGKHGQRARPFLEPARRASRKAAIAAMEKKFDEEVKKL